MKMKAKVMNLMPLEGFEVKKSWGVTVGLGGVSPILGRLLPEVGVSLGAKLHMVRSVFRALGLIFRGIGLIPTCGIARSNGKAVTVAL